MANERNAFSVWLKRVAAMRIRQTMLLCGGNEVRAARMLGCSRWTVRRTLAWDNARLDRLAHGRRKSSCHNDKLCEGADDGPPDSVAWAIIG